MKKVWQWASAVIVLTLALAYVRREPLLDAEQIVAHSAFKNRTFRGVTEEVTTEDGKVQAYLMAEHSVPLVAVSFGFDKAGTAYEPKVGTAILAADVMANGAGAYSRQELRDVMKEKGIRFGVAAERDRLTFSFSYVKNFEKEALEIIKAILYQPHFDEEELALSRHQFSVARKKQQESPQYLLQKLIKAKFYGTHPYARENIPDDAAMNAVSRGDIRAYLQAVMGKDNLKVGIAGDIDGDGATMLLTTLFKDLPDRAKVNDLPELVIDFGREAAQDQADFSAQNFVLLVAQGIERTDDDFYPLYVADYILGGAGLNSRLNKTVREEKGLTYGIYSTLTHSDAVNLWQIYFSATPANAAEALLVAQQTYDDFYAKGISEAELNTAKKGLMASFNLRFSSLLNIAEMLEQIQVQRLGIDFLQKRQSLIQKVSLNDVNRVIKKYFPKYLNSKGKVRLFEIIGK